MIKDHSRTGPWLSSTALPIAALTVASALALLPTSAAAQTVASFQTPEYNASKALDQINAAAAYAAGFTGKGVAIGIIDTGLDMRHAEFAAPGKFLGGYNFATKTAITAGQNGDTDFGQPDSASHGTFIAGIAAASRDGTGIQGVAYDSGIYATTTYAYTAEAWDWLVERGVPVINNSFGINDCTPGKANPTPKCSIADYSVSEATSTNTDTVTAARRAIAANTLLVFATGNETQSNPDFWAGLPYRIPDLQKGWLAVGSVDEANNRSSFSNACGVAAQWCLVAPGELYSTVVVGTGDNGGNYKAGQGTSYATPVVVGVAALTKQAYPWFTNYDLQQTLLTTATPLGSRTAGSITPDAIYGWGLVNAGAAVKGYGGFVTMTTLDTKGYNSTFSNNIYGPGGLIKTGAGTLTLSGTNTYTDTTTVNGGALAVTGSIVSQVTVAQGGAFGGSGQVGATTVNGTLGLGTPQTLTINGNLAFGASGTYLASIQGALSDLVKVNGSAALAGTLAAQTLGGTYTFNTPYTVLSATGGVNGTFGTFDRSRVGAGLVTSVAYTGSAVQLTLTPGKLAVLAETPPAAVTQTSTTTSSGGTTTVTTAVTATTPTNTQAKTDVARVAVAIDTAVSKGANAEPLFALYNSADEVLDSELNQLTGEVHTSVNRMGLRISTQFLGAMSDIRGEGRDPFNPSTSQALGYGPTPRPAGQEAIAKVTGTTAGVPTFGPKYSLWGGPITSYSTTSGDADLGTTRLTARSTQIVGGLDLRLDPTTLIGFAVAGGTASSSLADGLGSASAGMAQVGTYASTRMGALSLTGAGAFTWMDVTTHRAIPILGLADVTGRYQPTIWSGRLEAAYEVAKLSRVAFSPFAAFEAQSMRSPGFVEQDAFAGGAAVGGLTVAGQTGATTRSILGLDMRGSLDIGQLTMQGFVRAGWGHYFNQAASSTAFLTGIPGSDFTVTGTKSKPDAATLALGLNTRITQDLTLTTSFDSEFARNSQTYTGAARLRLAF